MYKLNNTSSGESLPSSVWHRQHNN